MWSSWIPIKSTCLPDQFKQVQNSIYYCAFKGSLKISELRTQKLIAKGILVISSPSMGIKSSPDISIRIQFQSLLLAKCIWKYIPKVNSE